MTSLQQVEDFISQQESSTQQEIMFYLHDLLLSYPAVSSCIRYRIPFYDRKSWICYLNPLRKSGGVELAFVRANELSDEGGLLDFKDRKQVAGISYHRVDEIEEDRLLAVFEEALLLDERVKYTVGKKK